jgi:hypothetical protein
MSFRQLIISMLLPRLYFSLLFRHIATLAGHAVAVTLPARREADFSLCPCLICRASTPHMLPARSAPSLCCRRPATIAAAI